MSSDTDAYDSYIGQIVSREISAGYVVLSYLVSYVGAWTTLELVNRRTAGKGLYNWYGIQSLPVKTITDHHEGLFSSAQPYRWAEYPYGACISLEIVP